MIDFEKFREIYDLYYESLCKFLIFYTKDAQIIEDLVQEIFLSLWENRHIIEISYIKTYLFQSARNKMLNYLRDSRNRSKLLEKWYEEQLCDSMADSGRFDIEQLTAKIQQAIESLPQKCKEIFILSKMKGLSYKKIAELKNISTKTVENQMGIALKKLRFSLSEYFPLFFPLLIFFLF